VIPELIDMMVRLVEALTDIDILREERLKGIHLVLTVKIFAINYPF